MTSWEAIAEIVKSFNARGSTWMALASVGLFVGVPSALLGLALWLGMPEAADAVINLLER